MMNPVIRYILTDLFNITGFSMSETPRGKPRGIFNSKEGDCIPLTPAPHSSPPLMAGYSAGKFHKVLQ